MKNISILVSESKKKVLSFALLVILAIGLIFIPLIQIVGAYLGVLGTIVLFAVGGYFIAKEIPSLFSIRSSYHLYTEFRHEASGPVYLKLFLKKIASLLKILVVVDLLLLICLGIYALFIPEYISAYKLIFDLLLWFLCLEVMCIINY